MHDCNTVLVVHGAFRHVCVSAVFTVRVLWEENVYNSASIVNLLCGYSKP